MEQIIGIDGKGHYIYEDDGQVDQEIQKVTNEHFLEMIGENTGDKLISLNKACEWLNDFLSDYRNNGYYLSSKDFDYMITNFKKAMEDERI